MLIKNPVMDIKIPEAKNEMIRPIELIWGNETCQKYIIKAKGKRMLKPVNQNNQYIFLEVFVIYLQKIQKGYTQTHC